MKTMMQPRQGEKRRYDDMIHDPREEAVVESLCRLGGGSPPGCGPAVESDKRMRREIANSNERRRMQSINAGFSSLKQLLPNKDGEKLSKAAILQQTADYIECLERENEQLKACNKKLKKLVSQPQESPDSSSSEDHVLDILSQVHDMHTHSKLDMPNTEFHSQPYAKKAKFEESPRIVTNTPPHRLSVSSPSHQMIISSSPQRLSTSSPPHIGRKVYESVVNEVVLPSALDDKEEKFVIKSEDDKSNREVYGSRGGQITYAAVKRENISDGFSGKTVNNNVRLPKTILVLPPGSSPHGNTVYNVGQSIMEIVKPRVEWVERVPSTPFTTVVEQHSTTVGYTTVVEPPQASTPTYTIAPRGPHPHIPPPQPRSNGQSSLETICEAIRHLEGDNFHSSREEGAQEKVIEDKAGYIYEEDLVRQDRRDPADSDRRILIEAYDSQSEEAPRSQPQRIRLEAYDSQSEQQQIRLEAYDSQMESQQLQDGYESQPEQQQLLISNNNSAYVSAPSYVRSDKRSPRYEVSGASPNTLVYEHIEPQEAPLELTTRGSGRSSQSELPNAYDSFSERTNVIVIGK